MVINSWIDAQVQETMILVIVASLVTGLTMFVLGYCRGRQDESGIVKSLKEQLQVHMAKEIDHYQRLVKEQRESDELRMELGAFKAECCLCAKHYKITPMRRMDISDKCGDCGAGDEDVEDQA